MNGISAGIAFVAALRITILSLQPSVMRGAAVLDGDPQVMRQRLGINDGAGAQSLEQDRQDFLSQVIDLGFAWTAIAAHNGAYATRKMLDQSRFGTAIALTDALRPGDEIRTRRCACGK